ncbi:MAG: epimerase, partial [Planctomycetes bacterium]|nr:epimerase [Planctomycetota bacterium]
FQIRFSGATDYQHVGDCAAAFVAAADRGPAGAAVYNLHGESVDMDRVRELIVRFGPTGTAERISVDGPVLPIPPALDAAAIAGALGELPRISLEDGVRLTMEHFARLESR